MPQLLPLCSGIPCPISCDRASQLPLEIASTDLAVVSPYRVIQKDGDRLPTCFVSGNEIP